MHESSSLKELLGSIKEQLFRTGEKERLQSMARHSLHRDNSTHADLLSKVHDTRASARQQSSEHNGLKFWTYYFEDEHPDFDEPLPEYIDKAWDEKLNLVAHTLEAPFTHLEPEKDGIGDSDQEMARRWLRDFTLAQIAYGEGNYPEAELRYQSALDYAQRLTKKRTRKQALAAKGLADSLIAQNRVTEADTYYEVAISIDAELLGGGEVSIEDEFYNIAGHFVAEGKLAEMEKLLVNLAGWLQLSIGRNDPILARCMNELGTVYSTELKFKEAEPYFVKALEILERFAPSSGRQLAAVHSNYAALCEACGRVEEAQLHFKEAMKCLES